MAIQRASWADLGYRKLGPLPVSGGGLTPHEVGVRLARTADYEVTSDHWARHRARRKGVAPPASIRIAAVLGQATAEGDQSLDFLEGLTDSQWAKVASELPQLRTAFTDAIELVKDAEKAENRWRAFYFLSSAIAFVAPEFLRPLLRQHLLPCFFRMYPEGKLVVLRYDTSVDTAASALRALYAMAQAPWAELAKKSVPGVATLREWHMTSLAYMMPALLDFFNYLFYLFLGGASFPTYRSRHCHLLGVFSFFAFLLDAALLGLIGERALPREWVATPAPEVFQRALGARLINFEGVFGDVAVLVTETIHQNFEIAEHVLE